MIDEFEYSVTDSYEKYRRENYRNPKYLIINNNTFSAIRDRVVKRKMFGILDKKIYKELYIAIDDELEDYEFVIAG